MNDDGFREFAINRKSLLLSREHMIIDPIGLGGAVTPSAGALVAPLAERIAEELRVFVFYS